MRDLESKAPETERAKFLERDAQEKVARAEKEAERAKELAKAEKAKRLETIARSAATSKLASVKLAHDTPGMRKYLEDQLASKLAVEESDAGPTVHFVDGATKKPLDEHWSKYVEKDLADYIEVPGGSGAFHGAGKPGTAVPDMKGWTDMEKIEFGWKNRKR